MDGEGGAISGEGAEVGDAAEAEEEEEEEEEEEDEEEEEEAEADEAEAEADEAEAEDGIPGTCHTPEGMPICAAGVGRLVWASEPKAKEAGEPGANAAVSSGPEAEAKEVAGVGAGARGKWVPEAAGVGAGARGKWVLEAASEVAGVGAGARGKWAPEAAGEVVRDSEPKAKEVAGVGAGARGRARGRRSVTREAMPPLMRPAGSGVRAASATRSARFSRRSFAASRASRRASSTLRTRQISRLSCRGRGRSSVAGRAAVTRAATSASGRTSHASSNGTRATSRRAPGERRNSNPSRGGEKPAPTRSSGAGERAREPIGKSPRKETEREKILEARTTFFVTRQKLL
jgi:hypothetical protein